MKLVDRVLEQLQGVTERSGGWQAQCPAHEDHRPSLSIKEGTDGRVLLKCFANCPTEAVVAALGLQMSDLFAESDDRRDDCGKAPIIWQIKDTEGKVQAEHVRFDQNGGKECLWRLPGADTWGLHGRKLSTLPLYGSEQAKDWPEDVPVVVVAEGEPATDALLAVGFCALGTVTGANVTPGPEALEVLRSRRVVLWCDNDEPGRAHMQRIAEALEGIASEVRVFEWAEAPRRGDDAADHPAIKSKKREAIRELLDQMAAAPVWQGITKNNLSLRLDSGSIDRTEGGWDEPGSLSEGVSMKHDVQGESGGTQFATFTAADLLAEELPESRWAVPGIVPEGVTLLAGKPKLGKSWASLGLCLDVAMGGMALGTVRVEQGEALYLALEDNLRRLQKRLRKLLKDDAAPTGLHMATDWPRIDEGGVDWLDAWLEAHRSTRLVIVDTLARFKPRISGGYRSAYDTDREAVDPLAPVAAEHGVAIVLVHHLREMESNDPLDMITGSVGLTGGVDGALVLKRQRGQADAYLHVDGRDIEQPAELALNFDTETATWTIVGDAEEYRMSEGRRAISHILENADESLSPKEITAMLNERGHEVKDGAVREMLSQMVKDGQAKNLGRGAYVRPSFQDIPDNADNLTNGRTNDSVSGMSGHSSVEAEAQGAWKEGEL